MMENTDFVEIYHYREWDHGYDAYCGSKIKRRDFYADMSNVVKFLLTYISYCNITEFVVAPLHKISQFACNPGNEKNDIYIEICEFLKKHKIRKNSQSGVKLSIKGNVQVIEMVLEGAFRGISDLCLLFPEKFTILEPTHHMALLFLTNDIINEKHILMKLLQDYPDLRFFEGKYDVDLSEII